MNKKLFEACDYTQLVEEINTKAAYSGQPINGTFELTERCNLSCKMCYVCQPATSRTYKSQELSAQQWIKIAKEAKIRGTVFLLLTGGEPFLRSDFFDIYEPLSRMGFFITLFTNGTLITDTIAKRLAKHPPHRTEVSLYGATAKTYESITRVAGSFGNCCTGIESLRRNNIPLALKATIVRQNLSEVEAMQKIAKKWGLHLSLASVLFKRRDRKKIGVENCRLSIEQFIRLYTSTNLPYEIMTKNEREKECQTGKTKGGKSLYCMAGRASYLITSAGKMNICTTLAKPSLNTLELGFSLAWDRLKNYVITIPTSKKFRECNLKDFCLWCPAWSYIETGTLTDPVSYLCEIAKSRKNIYESLV